MEIVIWDEQLIQLDSVSIQTGLSTEHVVNSAINEFYHNFIAEQKRLEFKIVK